MTASFWRWWGPALAYMAFIFWMSSRARPAAFDDTPDLALHGGAYFLLCVLLVRALSRGLRRKATGRALYGGAILAVLYGVTDEWHQGFTATRVASVGDVAADAVGAIGAVVALSLMWWLRAGPSQGHGHHQIDSSEK